MSRGKCPKCGAALKPEEGALHGRACTSCEGTWFDVLRLESLPERNSLAHEVITVYSALRAQDLPSAGLDCPACGKDLERGEYGRVEVDLCDDCKGLWFDRFELEGVLDPTTTRPCPKCEAPMRATEWNDVPVNACRGCGGHWLDVRLLESQPDVTRATEQALDALIAAFAIPSDAPTQPTTHSCPTCKGLLSASESHGIELDFCFRCRGLFLDAGELESITKLDAPAVEKAASAMEAGAQALGRLLGRLRRLAG